MNLSGISSAASLMAQSGSADAVNTTVMRKALNMAADSTQQLIEAVPKPTQASNPSHLGQKIDVMA